MNALSQIQCDGVDKSIGCKAFTKEMVTIFFLFTASYYRCMLHLYCFVFLNRYAGVNNVELTSDYMSGTSGMYSVV